MATMARLRASLAGAFFFLAIGGPSGSTCALAAADDMFTTDGPVVTLTRSTLISSVLESDTPAMVWYYSGSDCPQCDKLAPIIETAARKLTSWGLSVAALDVGEEPKLAKELGIPKSMPMLMKVYHSESTKNPYGGLPVRSEEYIGNFKDARDLQKNVLTVIPNLVASVDMTGDDSSALKEALAKGEEGYAAILLMESGKSSPVLRVLASRLRGNVSAVQARMPKRRPSEDEGEEEGDDRTSSLARLLDGVIEVPGWSPSVPSLVLVDKASGKGEAFDGDVDDAEALLDFIRNGATISPPASDSESSSSSGGSASSQKNERGGVLKLDPESLARLEEKGVEALVVAFVDGGDVSVIPGWSEATKGLQGQIRAGVFDCGAHPSHCEGSKKAPHVRVYPHRRGLEGDNRGLPSILPPSQVKQAISEAEASLPEIVAVIPAGTDAKRAEEALRTVVGSSLLGEGSPMCLFVLSRREEPNSVVKTIAAEFQTAKIKTVFLSRPHEQVMAGLGVSTLPAMVLLFQANEGMDVQHDGKKPADGEQAMVTAQYATSQWGPITHQHVSAFVLSHLSSVSREAFFLCLREMADNASLNEEKLPEQIERLLEEHTQSNDDSSPQEGGAGDGRPAPPFQGVPEVTSETWGSVIGENTGFPRNVGVFLLDRYSEGFGSALKAAESAAEQVSVRHGGNHGFVWVDVPCQEGFARTLGVSDASELPVLVMFSPKHQKSARFVGAWEEDSLASFLGRALAGRTPVFPVGDAAPSLEALDCSQREAPAWLAGGDGEGVGGLEEDDDMGDFMAEILAEEAKAKRELEEEVAKGLEELREAEGANGDRAAPKKKKKIVKRKKKKGGSSASRSEL